MRPRLLAALATLLAISTALVFWFARRPPALPTGGVVQTAAAGDLRITLWIDAAALGPRLAEVRVYDAAGQSADVRSARLCFTMDDMPMPPLDADVQPLGRGRFQARGSFFAMAGQWNATVVLQRDGQPDLRAAFVLPIAAPGEVAGPPNPLLADAATLAAGRQLYAENCAACHGARGKGDGPLAPGLAPRPADFTQHMVPGQHSDGQVFLWIKQGFPGGAMPAWGNRLDDRQIWQVVTYLRSFGRPVNPTTIAEVTPSPLVPTVAPATAVAEPLPPLILARQGNLWHSDGKGSLQQLTDLGAQIVAEHPAVAPSGARIAFIARGPGPIDSTLPVSSTTLYVINSDGTGMRALWRLPGGGLALPAWAPDGQSLYVGHSQLRSDPQAPVSDWLFEIVRVEIATTARRTVLIDARDPTFSRDGTQLAYLRYDRKNAAFALHVAAPDGSADREVIGTGAFSSFYAPRFAPDGKRVVVAAIGGPVTDEQGYPIRGQGRSPLEGLLSFFAPAVAEAHGPPWDLWVVNVDGSGLRRLPGAHEDTPMAVFSPDGRQLVMMGAGGIYLIDADNGRPRLIDALGDHGGLDWASR